MRIAFLNRGREAHPGGDVIQLDATMAALRKLGVECDDVGWDVPRLREYDLCHMMHCQFSWSWGNFNAIKDAGKKYVLTPIYYPGCLFEGITKDQLHEMLRDAELLLPFSHEEVNDMLGYLPTDLIGGHCRIIPNGTDLSFYRENGDPELDANGDVLCVSARGPSDKNIDQIRRACELAGLNFYCATAVLHADLPEVYAGYRIFVNASDSERMSLTIGEALCTGCRVLATKHNRGNEWYGPGLYTFDPQESVETLAARIQAVDRLSDGQWDWSPNAKARLLTWDLVAAQLKSVYEQVLA